MRCVIAFCLLMAAAMSSIQCAAPSANEQLRNAQQEYQERLEESLEAQLGE